MTPATAAPKKQTTIVNGIDVDALLARISAIEESETTARFRVAAVNRWQEGGHNPTTVDEFEGACQPHRRTGSFVFDADEPPVPLGQDPAANPVEFYLDALAACVTSAVVYHASTRGIRIHRIQSELDDLDTNGFLGVSDAVRNGSEEIRFSMRVEADATPEQIEELVALGQARSPVFDMVTHGVPVRVTLAK